MQLMCTINCIPFLLLCGFPALLCVFKDKIMSSKRGNDQYQLAMGKHLARCFPIQVDARHGLGTPQGALGELFRFSLGLKNEEAKQKSVWKHMQNKAKNYHGGRQIILLFKKRKVSPSWPKARWSWHQMTHRSAPCQHLSPPECARKIGKGYAADVHHQLHTLFVAVWFSCPLVCV